MPNIESLMHDLAQANPGYSLSYDMTRNYVIATPNDLENDGATYYYDVMSSCPMWRRGAHTRASIEPIAESTPIREYCSECGRRYIVENEEEYNNEDTHMCPNCKEMPKVKCEICGEYHVSHASFGSDDEFHMCRSCYNHYVNENPINRFNYKPEPIFYGTPTDGAYFGVEVEVDYGVHGWMTASKITHDFSEVYVKHDGSLEEEGIEVVTHPASLEYHKTAFPWDRILNMLRHYGYQADTTDTCGLHIHVSRKFFGDNTTEQDCNIAKLILIVQRFWDSHIVPFSRRRVTRLQRWAKKPEFRFNTNASIGSIVDKQKRELCRDHYNGINILPPNTVEFRMFRGSMDRSIILASMELVYALSKFAKNIELRDIDSCTWEQVFEGMNRTEYKELFDYMETKCLFDSSRMETIFDDTYVEYEFMQEEDMAVRNNIESGSLVVIREWDSMMAEFGGCEGMFSRNDIATPRAYFIEPMRPLCGHMAIVDEVYDDRQVELHFVESDESIEYLSGFTFSLDMLRVPTREEMTRYYRGCSAVETSDGDGDDLWWFS